MYGFQANISAEVTGEVSGIVTIVGRWRLLTNLFHYVSQIWEYRAFYNCYFESLEVPCLPLVPLCLLICTTFACLRCQCSRGCVCVMGKKTTI